MTISWIVRADNQVNTNKKMASGHEICIWFIVGEVLVGVNLSGRMQKWGYAEHVNRK